MATIDEHEVFLPNWQVAVAWWSRWQEPAELSGFYGRQLALLLALALQWYYTAIVT